MNILRKLFGGANPTTEKSKQEQDAKNFEILKFDGVAAMRQNSLDYAIKCFTHALELKDDGETRDYLARAMVHNNDFAGAYGQLEYLAAAEPDNVRIWLRMADVAYMMESYIEMTEACEKANEIDSDSVQVNYAYARACIGLGNFVNAIALLTKAINLSKADPYWDAYLLRGRTLMKLGEVEAAERDADSMLDNIGEQEDAMMLKAWCMEVRGDHVGALIYYDKVIDVSPFCLDAFRERAEIRNANGDTQGAEEDYAMIKEILARGPQEDTAAAEGQNIEQATQEAYRRINPLA